MAGPLNVTKVNYIISADARNEFLMDTELSIKPVQISDNDELALARFGCAFSSAHNLVLVNWDIKREKQALKADIAARTIHFESSSGSVFALALEISMTKALAVYCYFPFDLTNETHKQYLSAMINKGEIQLRFVVESHGLTRNHKILPGPCKRIADQYTTAISACEQFPVAQYDFASAVAEFEDKIRVVDYFRYT